MKWAVESYWAGKSSEKELQAVAATVRRNNWQLQRKQGIRHIPSNDFSFYDQMLDTSAMIGAVPPRYGYEGGPVGLDTYFAMARGTTGAEDEPSVPAMEMTKWFDTNYHYIVPELQAKQSFRLSSRKVIDEFVEAKALGIHTKPVLIGPVTYLLLSKTSDEKNDTLALLEEILPVYEQVLKALAEEGAEWVQVDEPMLGLTLDDRQRAAFGLSFARLAATARSLKIMATVYFSDLRENLKVALALPVAGLHVDLVRGPGQLDDIMAKLPEDMTLSLGLVNGRNIWKSDLARVIATADHAASTIGINRVVIAPSCSLMHAPVDLDTEPELDAEMKSWLAFARQKIGEVVTITRALNQSHGIGADGDADTGTLQENSRAMESRRSSSRIHNPEAKERIASIDDAMYSRNNDYAERHRVQQLSIRLPEFPTTTIGSFPQTPEIRKARAAHNRGELKDAAYDKFLKAEIAGAIRFQEEVGLDVLVHGEPERNDMVEYFGQQMDGYVSTKNGWVQSYGSRCVKPPIIYGDVRRTGPMTVEWTKYAQSLTNLPVKGMLTGPITMLEWSFVRDDQPRSETCRQLALAIRDEVSDLERAGIRIIQIDEPAMREGLPLRREDWEAYLEWAVECFRLAASGVEDSTQIHTHMCYAEFNDIIEAIGNLDADVISMEASRSDMVLLGAFGEYKYPNEIGPGVYDIHSPRVASSEEMKALLGKALDVLTPGQLWVNPDCGLKTRKWEEVKPSLENMVAAAKSLR
jgi:5-methyltetrahydropteroyltriglutamate--homocysteine methyltransferase